MLIYSVSKVVMTKKREVTEVTEEAAEAAEEAVEAEAVTEVAAVAEVDLLATETADQNKEVAEAKSFTTTKMPSQPYEDTSVPY